MLWLRRGFAACNEHAYTYINFAECAPLFDDGESLVVTRHLGCVAGKR